MDCNNNKTSFKVYFKDEIHRVSIASSAPTFAQLVDTIKTILHSSELNTMAPIKVHYFDEDKDRITVGTQQEWLEALSALATQQIKKIYVSQEQEHQKQQQQQRKKLSRHICVNVSAEKPKEAVNRLNELVERIIEKGEEAITSEHTSTPALRHRLHVLSLAFLKKGEYEKACNVLKGSLKLSPNWEVSLYNLACTYALMGKRHEACVLLKQAVDKGYRNLRQMMADDDLESLRELPEYVAIIESLKSECTQNVLRRGYPLRFGCGSVRSTLLDPRRFSPVAKKQQEEEEEKEKKKEEEEPKEEEKKSEPESESKPEPKPESEAEVKKENESEPEAEKENESENERYGDEKKQLVEMGFTDEGLISALLVVEGGDVTKVASLLLGMMD